MAKQERFYAVKKGRKPGVYKTWDECSEQVKGFEDNEYKSFPSEDAALAWLGVTPSIAGPESLSPEERESFERGMADYKAIEALEYLVEQGLMGEDVARDIRARMDARVNGTVKPAAKADGIRMFVDGSYNAETGQYGYGVYIEKDGKVKVMRGCADAQDGGRNVEGEVAAALAGLQALQEAGGWDGPITVYHDYEGIGAWADGTWKANKGYTQDYAQRIRMMRSTGMDIRFSHVYGHTGVEENEYVDVLAKSACGVPLTASEKARLDEVLSMGRDAVDGFQSGTQAEPEFE